METTTAQRKAALEIAIAVSETIRELGRVPSGHLYAMLMSRMSFEAYANLIDGLKRAGLVVETNSSELIWKGPSL